jgi:hypothetical protein
VPKGEKKVVKRYIPDKAKRSIINALVEQVKKLKHSPNIGYEIWLYNNKIIGFHNYYQIATHCNIDFRSIAFIVSRALKHSIKLKRARILSGYIKEKYGGSKQLRFVGETAVVPIGYIQNRTPLDKRVAINNYATESRKEIHKVLAGVNIATLQCLTDNVPNFIATRLRYTVVRTESASSRVKRLKSEICTVITKRCTINAKMIVIAIWYL